MNTLYYPNVFGGAERSVQFLAENLVKAGHNVVVACTVSQQGRHVEKINDVSVHYIGLKNIYWPYNAKKPKFLKPVWQAIDAYNAGMAQEVAKLIDEEQPDVIHTNNLLGFSVVVWKIAKQKGIPLVHTIRDYYLLCPDSSMFRKGRNCVTPCWKCRLYSLPKYRLSEMVDAVVGNSRFILEKHLQFGYFSRAANHVIFNAYQTADNPVDVCRDGKLRIGFIGRLRHVKGIEQLLRAVNLLDANQVEVIVAGSGTERYELKLRQMGGKHSKFLGFVESQEFFSQIDLLVVPSLWHEPLPRTIFEAYAHGIPVIGSRRGGIPELIDEGRTGFLFDPDNIQDLVEKVKRFVDAPALAVNMRAFCLAKAKDFLPSKIVAQYLAVYNQAIALNQSRGKAK